MSVTPVWTNDISRLCREYSLASSGFADQESSVLSMRLTSTTEMNVGFLVRVHAVPGDPEALSVNSWDINYGRPASKVEAGIASLAAEAVAASATPYSELILNPSNAVPLHGVSWTSDPVFNVHIAISSYTNWVSHHHWMRDFLTVNSNVALALTAPSDPLTEVNLWVNNRRVDFTYYNEASQLTPYLHCLVWPRAVDVPSLYYSRGIPHFYPEWKTQVQLLNDRENRILRPEKLALAYEALMLTAPSHLFD